MTRTLRALSLGMLTLGGLGAGTAGAAGPMVDANYPGGNIVVEGIEGDTIHLRPDWRDTEGGWFYWNFRVRGAEGRTLTFRFTGPNPIGVRGPAVSTDRGQTWPWLGAEAVQEGSFKYTFPAGVQEVRFSFGIPYQEQNLKEFLAKYKGSPHVAVQELSKSEHGRSVERLHMGRLDGERAYRVLVTARHHACEAMADYVMEGLLESILADNEDGYWFRRNVEIVAVPFMDKDGKQSVRFDIEVDFPGDGSWRLYQSFVVVPERNYVHYEFPDGFSAPWVRVKVDRDCLATVYFTYN